MVEITWWLKRRLKAYFPYYSKEPSWYVNRGFDNDTVIVCTDISRTILPTFIIPQDNALNPLPCNMQHQLILRLQVKANIPLLHNAYADANGDIYGRHMMRNQCSFTSGWHALLCSSSGCEWLSCPITHSHSDHFVTCIDSFCHHRS